jgi:hypothetical protein
LSFSCLFNEKEDDFGKDLTFSPFEPPTKGREIINFNKSKTELFSEATTKTPVFKGGSLFNGFVKPQFCKQQKTINKSPIPLQFENTLRIPTSFLLFFRKHFFL